VVTAADLEDRAFAAMAGGDYALIKAVEGFEDFTDFGKKQLGDLGVSSRDVVFAITEGGETSFVIGTAWKAIEAGAKVYFVYNNPDEVLHATVQRSREVLDEPRIEKVNLTTGPMAITGSTRMQATTIQLCVLLTVLEMVVRTLLRELSPEGSGIGDPAKVPEAFLAHLKTLNSTLKSVEVLNQLAALVTLEETVYAAGRKNNYFADRFAIDVLTDTTERSPTYCTPPFRKFDDTTASESWAFLFTPTKETSKAWERLLKHVPDCIDWTEAEVRELVAPEKIAGTRETVRKIGYSELMRFRIGLDGLETRSLSQGDVAVGVVSEKETESLTGPNGFHRTQLDSAHHCGARVGLLYFGRATSLQKMRTFLSGWPKCNAAALFPVPETDFLLDGLTRIAVKTVLNALSTCTMVRLGRVMGNCMIWVVPSNLKLIDRATRYIRNLTGLSYQAANELLFEVIEYVTPRMKADQAYPPVVGISVLRARYQLTNERAEQRLQAEMRASTVGQGNR
jgi:N-acetylmuramic acid 6-phosphate etherase